MRLMYMRERPKAADHIDQTYNMIMSILVLLDFMFMRHEDIRQVLTAEEKDLNFNMTLMIDDVKQMLFEYATKLETLKEMVTKTELQEEE